MSGALLGLALGACGLLYGAGLSRGLPGGPRPVPGTDLVDWVKHPCLTYTGGTCTLLSCNAERKATCSWGSCVCPSGCVGASGNCYRDMAGYELVASNIKLRNVKYDGYLYTPDTWFMSQLRIYDRGDTGSYSDKWNVYRVPGAAFGKEFYIISPVKYPGYASGVGPNPDPLAFSPYRVIVASMSSTTQDPWGFFQQLCEPPLHPGAFEISNLQEGGNGVKWYVHHGSWEVFGYLLGAVVSSLKVGEGGEWMPEPPVNLSLPQCQ